jgi:hypothetical protein
MKIAEFKPTGELTFKAFQDGANSYAISCTYQNEIQYKVEFSSFDTLNQKWENTKKSYQGVAS